jgi:hypothetical protein
MNYRLTFVALWWDLLQLEPSSRAKLLLILLLLRIIQCQWLLCSGCQWFQTPSSHSRRCNICRDFQEPRQVNTCNLLMLPEVVVALLSGPARLRTLVFAGDKGGLYLADLHPPDTSTTPALPVVASFTGSTILPGCLQKRNVKVSTAWWAAWQPNKPFLKYNK